MNEQELKLFEAAIGELKNPTLGTTQQILAVHEVRNFDDQNNFFIDGSDAPNNYKIFFSVKGEPYFLVIVFITEGNQLLISSSYIEGYTRVYIGIYSDDLCPEEISKLVGLAPTRTRLKNTVIKGERIAKEHQWFYEPQQYLPGSLELKLAHLLDELSGVKRNIAALPSGVGACIYVCYKGYKDWMGGWHFDSKLLNQIAGLKIEMDFDLYASGPDIP